MPKKLDTAEVISATITDEEITSFTIDLTNGSIYIVFDRKDINSVSVISDASHVLEAAEMTAAITRASQIAGADVYAAIKQALYEFLPGNGTIA